MADMTFELTDRKTAASTKISNLNKSCLMEGIIFGRASDSSKTLLVKYVWRLYCIGNRMGIAQARSGNISCTPLSYNGPLCHLHDIGILRNIRSISGRRKGIRGIVVNPTTLKVIQPQPLLLQEIL
jgi:hypothetical protein